MKINVLSEEVIGKISAGEVVERPASVIKELIENSIDAGADSIDVEIEGAGIDLIRVADNGMGMSGEDARFACFRHATSKISEADDLYRINTLGFRGEALASIAAVSKMEITTFDDAEENGTCIYLESGEILKTRPKGRSRGTTIEAANLFYNVPARRKFLKKGSAELAEIVSVVGRFIVSNPNIDIRLTQEDRVLLDAKKDSGHLKRVGEVLGKDAADGMIEIEGEDGEYKIKGFISQPSQTRKDRRGQMIFMNGRFIRSRFLSDILQTSYRSMLERGTYPLAVIFLTVSPSDVDVNVHPAKLMVKFSDEKRIKNLVQETIQKGIELAREKKLEKYRINQSVRKGNLSEDLILQESLPEEQSEFAYQDGESQTPDCRPQTTGSLGAWETTGSEKRQEMFQVGGCYIVQINSNEVTITDQHAAHERVLYEFFSKAKELGPPETQNLLFPVVLDLTREESVLMDKMIESFMAIGFSIEPFGDNTFAVQSVPAILRDRDIKTVVEEALRDISVLNMSKIDRVDELVKIASCRGAIKAGDKLDNSEMMAVLKQLSECALPFTCPHGRPTSFNITIDEMERRFRRK